MDAKETQTLIEGINEEIRLLNEEDDLFSGRTAATQAIAQIHKQTGEIPPVEKLATPLIPERVNNPLPQRPRQEGGHKSSEIPPDNTLNFMQGKPPAHNNKPARRQIDYDGMGQVQNQYNLNWEDNTSYMQLPTDKTQTQLEQFSLPRYSRSKNLLQVWI